MSIRKMDTYKALTVACTKHSMKVIIVLLLLIKSLATQPGLEPVAGYFGGLHRHR